MPKAALVSTTVAVRKSLPVEIRVIGNVEAYSTIRVRAQVSGQLTKVYFQEGQDVKAGDLLFLIDPRPYDEAIRQAKRTWLETLPFSVKPKPTLNETWRRKISLVNKPRAIKNCSPKGCFPNSKPTSMPLMQTSAVKPCAPARRQLKALKRQLKRIRPPLLMPGSSVATARSARLLAAAPET